MSTTIESTAGLVIGGRLVETRETFGVINPATGEVFAQAPSASRDDVDAAMQAADDAFADWSSDEDFRRSSIHAVADAMEASVDRLAAVLTAEQGKSLADSASEVATSVVWLRYYADLDLPTVVVQDDELGYAEVQRRPIGPVAAITPWNFPLTLAMWKIAPALRAGNTLVVKPSPYTPLATLVLGDVLRDVLPAGVLNVVTSDDAVTPLGGLLVTHPLTRKVSFTGSTAVGKLVMAAAADDLKRVTLELGGNDPAVVMPGTSVAEMAEKLFWGAFYNNGQICLATKRVYVHRDQQRDLVDALADIARSVVVGDGAAPGTVLGPVNNRPQFDRVSLLVDDAARRGARVVTGGSALDRPGYFYSPTIVTDLDDEFPLVSEEQFGPALPIVAYDDLDDAIARANSGPYALTSSVWSDDPAAAIPVAERMSTGSVSINVHGGAVRPDLPFSGLKWSGIGVENGPWGLHEFTQTRAIAGPARR